MVAGLRQPSQGPPWSSPPFRFRLEKSKIHIWRADVRPSAPLLYRLKSTLCSDEVAAAQRFSFQKDQDRYITTRGVLRMLLGLYLRIDPRNVRFGYGPRGKPLLEGPSQDKNICFNISHSGDLALFAFSRNREVGVDVERIRDDISDEEISKRFFSAGERSRLRITPTQLQVQEFFRYWTCKEAYIKARGEGLHLPLNQFEVLIVPGDRLAKVRTEEESAADSQWYAQTLAPGAGYAGAVVAQGRAWECVCWDWTEDSP